MLSNEVLIIAKKLLDETKLEQDTLVSSGHVYGLKHAWVADPPWPTTRPAFVPKDPPQYDSIPNIHQIST